MSNTAIYVGIDIGDKTTSMYYVTGMSDSQIGIKLPGTIGNEPLDSTVCVLKNGKKILKNSIDSYELRAIERIYHNFKYQPDLVKDTPKYFAMKAGVTSLIDCIFESAEFYSIIYPIVQNVDEIVFCIGYPTNWNEASLNEYKKIISSCILGDEGRLYNDFSKPVRVYFERESTGAYVYLNNQNRQSNCFNLSTGGNILVLDFGSSTVNITALGKDSRHALYSSGNNRFGGRQLDALIAADLISLFSSRQKKFFQELNRLNNNAAKKLLIIAAADIKENLSSHEKCKLNFSCMDGAVLKYDVSRLRNIALNTPMNFAKDIIPGIISDYEENSWGNKLKEYLASEKANLAHAGIQPEAVILTGGGASMPIVQQICTEVFGKIYSLNASDSSTIIARGLALSAKNIDKADDFVKAMERFVNESVPRKVEAEFSTLINAISKIVTEQICSDMQWKFISWRNGHTTTFNCVISGLRNDINMNTILQTQEVASSIQTWYQTKLYKSLNDELKAICQKFNAGNFNLPSTISISLSGLSLPSSNIVNQMIEVVIANVFGAFVVGLIIAMFLSVVGIPILAAAAGVSVPVLLFKGWEGFKQTIIDGLKPMDLPMFVRSLVNDNEIAKVVNDNRPQIESAVKGGIMRNRSGLESVIRNTITEQIDSKLSEIKYELHTTK